MIGCARRVAEPRGPAWLLAVALFLAASVVLSGCGAPGNEADSGRATITAPMRVAPEVLARAADDVERGSAEILALPGVVGVGVGFDERRGPLALVLLERPGVAGVPSRVGRLPVRIEVVGTIRPFALTDRYRPLPIGVSSGNAMDCLPGTIGCVLAVQDKRYLLSANHVFARQNHAQIGEAITQPSLPDADPTCANAPPPTVVAQLSDFEPVIYDGRTPNRFDAAIAELTTSEGTCATLPAYYGRPSSLPVAPAVGAAILKVGRTTELTRGSIKAIDLKVKITFPAGTALFVGQILTTKRFGDFGDSGSLVVTDDGAFHPVAMVIGGGSNGVAIASPIGPILERFGAAVCGD